MNNIKWHPPPHNILKANFNGSVHPPANAVAGFVVRNEAGNPILAMSEKLGHMDILVAEVVALRNGLLELSQHTTHSIMVEGDSQLRAYSCSDWSHLYSLAYQKHCSRYPGSCTTI
ncbi:hypothetical protein ACLB2K_020793 [Fragaria x ananassa]